MTTAALQAYAAVIGMPRLAPTNALLFLSRVRFFETLFGPLVERSPGRGIYIEQHDVLNVHLRVEGVTYETNADFAERMYRTWRRLKEVGL